jgi:hypothetical protein
MAVRKGSFLVLPPKRAETPEGVVASRYGHVRPRLLVSPRPGCGRMRSYSEPWQASSCPFRAETDSVIPGLFLCQRSSQKHFRGILCEYCNVASSSSRANSSPSHKRSLSVGNGGLESVREYLVCGKTEGLFRTLSLCSTEPQARRLFARSSTISASAIVARVARGTPQRGEATRRLSNARKHCASKTQGDAKTQRHFLKRLH